MPDQRPVDLVLGPGAGPHQPRAPLKAPAQRPDALVRQPQPLERARGQQLRERAGVEPVGLRPSLADPGVARADHDHLGDVGLDDPGDLEGVAGHLEHHPIVAAEAAREQLERLGSGLDPTRRAHLAALRDRDLAEVTVDVQADGSHLVLPSS
jgi:hypothetical protein